MHGLIETRGPGVVPSDQLAAAARSLATPADSGKIADMIESFFRERRIG